MERLAPVAIVGEQIGAQTIQACRRGDRLALARVFASEGPYLERVLHRILGGNQDVEDVLQSALVAVIRAFPKYRGEASVRTWMTRIAVRAALAYLDHPERTRRVPLLVVSREVILAEEIDDRIDDRTRIERLQHHLDRISAKKRTAFLLHVCDGRPIAEVAALMGATKAATKSRVFWARRALMRAARRDPILKELLEEGNR